MIPWIYVVIVAACLVVFIIINLDNLLRFHRVRSATSAKPEIKPEIATALLFAGVGTVAFFLESLLYVFLGYSGKSQFPVGSLDFETMQTRLLEPFGLFLMVLGYGLFIWSVVARGRYATSWQMPADQELVTWGPYRYVRHPSYLGYFLMFVGLLVLWQNALAFIPIIGIPGYAQITVHEEQMLVAKFGEKYLQYRKHVGRFLPRTWGSIDLESNGL